MALSGCGLLGKEWTNNDNNYSAESYECAAWPPEPTGAYTQRDVAAYATDARGSYNDCRDKLKALNPNRIPAALSQAQKPAKHPMTPPPPATGEGMLNEKTQPFGWALSPLKWFF